jgi:hypothetical protein
MDSGKKVNKRSIGIIIVCLDIAIVALFLGGFLMYSLKVINNL